MSEFILPASPPASNAPGPSRSQIAAEVAGLFTDGGLADLPAVLRRPGPQPGNQIPPTFSAALAAVQAGRPRWPRLTLWLRLGRLVRRLARRTVRRDLDVLAEAVARLEGRR